MWSADQNNKQIYLNWFKWIYFKGTWGGGLLVKVFKFQSLTSRFEPRPAYFGLGNGAVSVWFILKHLMNMPTYIC